MPRDGSGGYARYTPGTPYTTGTVISSTVVNAEMDDLGNEVAMSLSKDGQTVPTNNLPMGGFRHTGVGNGAARNHYAAVGQVQDNAFAYAGTVGGTGDAITLTCSPSPAAYVAGQCFEFKATSVNTGAATVNINSLGVKDIKRGVSLALQAGDIPNGGLVRLQYDGTNFQILNPATTITQSPSDNSTKPASTAYADAAVASAVATNLSQVHVRQTVLSGPVDSGGLPDFGGSTGTTTVTASGTLIATTANGFSANGSVNRIGSITNPSWTSLSTNGTMFLYLDIAADGTCTAGSTTLAPTYQFGGTYSVANGQFTFNIQEMVGKVGNGATAAQTHRVFVGEVTVAGSVVTAITWYALVGRYRSALIAIPGTETTTTFVHNIGVTPSIKRAIARCNTAAYGFAIGDEINIPTSNFDGGSYITSINALSANRNAIYYRNPNLGAAIAVTAGSLRILDGNFTIRAEADRGW